MKQRQREQVQRGCAVGTVVLLAWLCRVLPLEGMPSGLQEACGILRLCNRQMFRVYRALSGRDLQSLKELHQQVWAPAPETPVLPAVQDAKLIQTGTRCWAQAWCCLQRDIGWSASARPCSTSPSTEPQPPKAPGKRPADPLGHASHSFVIPQKVTSQNLLSIAIP